MTAWDMTFSTPRIRMLQPGFVVKELDDKPQKSTNKVVLDSYRSTVNLWADSKISIPVGAVAKNFRVLEASRQKVGILKCTAEYIECTLVRRREPCMNGKVDATPLPARSPLQFLPLPAPRFTDVAEKSEHRLPGGEKKLPCNACGSKGATECSRCSGHGRLICGDCNGATFIPCEPTITYPNDIEGPCPRCRGTGRRPCPSCDPDGTVICDRCSGAGQLTCQTCQGAGAMREFTVLVREVTSAQSAFGLMREPWHVDLGALEDDMEELWAQDVNMSFPAARKGRAAFDVNGYSPEIAETALPTVHQFLQEHLAAGEVSAQHGKTLHAARLEILGCYLHRINYSFQGENPTEDYVFIGGLSNRVMPGALHERCKSSTAWIKRPFAKLLGGMGLAENHSHSSRFKQRFHEASGNVHLLDSRAVVVDAIELAGQQFSVTDLGYSLVSSDGKIGSINLQHVTDQEELGVGFSIPIGLARRDRFAAALRLCGDLLFGRIGIELDDEGRLLFMLYDNQYYASLAAAYYASVLRFLYDEAIPRAHRVLEA